jgi:hypothetical protein
MWRVIQRNSPKIEGIYLWTKEALPETVAHPRAINGQPGAIEIILQGLSWSRGGWSHKSSF